MNTDNLSIALIQADLAWENPEENRQKLEAQCREVSPETDLIILPEMFPTGFSMQAEKLAETAEGESFQWMKKLAKTKDAAVTGSIISSENGNYYNRLYFVFPNGDHETYDKKHLFTFADEHKHYSAGKERLIVEYKGWKICPLVCYDLRFPVWARNTEDFDLLIFIANWPAKRSDAWNTLLKARAIENMCYVAGINRVGVDGNDLPYNGHSAVYDVLGKQISTTEKESVFTETVELKKEDLEQARNQFSFLKDRDGFELT